eukprot:CAMPEP_0203739186 /NCGR_PEP_ID=MMETSP0092-20131115/45220_1 /ASSEMBLY_ACC=CAM_ASM_001090 /TAXON_ID=426623 /ORGANISM="Chaetoceros affinis, Strain CCMP159" /LENGTH=60 /DNA_ID=CAMNT_0050625163 /DNA_START=62 /DNA_END=240 /DNA_ORIENTATION=+
MPTPQISYNRKKRQMAIGLITNLHTTQQRHIIHQRVDADHHIRLVFPYPPPNLMLDRRHL